VSLKFKLAKGWMVDEIRGFDWLQKDDKVTAVAGAGTSGLRQVATSCTIGHDARHLPRGAMLDGLHILVIDDHASVRRMQRRSLVAFGATVTAVGTGAEGIAAARSGRPDAIIVDYEMPDMNGVQVCKELRADRMTARVPVLMLTGFVDENIHIAALQAGCDDFLSKPAPSAIVVSRLRNLVAHRRAEAESRELVERLASYVSVPLRKTGARHKPVERLEAAVMFSDLRGFTATSHVNDAEVVFRAVSEVLAHQCECVHRHGGYVDKFSGDGLLAVFTGDDSAEKAAAAALEVVQWAEGHGGFGFWQPPPIGFGINLGDVLRGDLGSDTRREFTVIGDAVNIAARLCGSAGSLEVIVSERVRDELADLFEFAPARAIRLKGLGETAVHPIIGIVSES